MVQETGKPVPLGAESIHSFPSALIEVLSKGNPHKAMGRRAIRRERWLVTVTHLGAGMRDRRWTGYKVQVSSLYKTT